MLRFDIINWLIEKYGYTNYLEIGAGDGDCFNQVECEEKLGVDPKCTINMQIRCTSDELFLEEDGLEDDDMFDIIFIDGLHLAEQVERDIHNSLKHLAEGGTIVVHDCNPPTEGHTTSPPQVWRTKSDGTEYPLWNGTVYQGFIHTHLSRDDLQCRCVDADWGCGIIQSGPRLPVADDLKYPETFDEFATRRKEYLNLITPTEFIEIYAS